MGVSDTGAFEDGAVHAETEQFSDEARALLRTAAEALAAQVLQHAETLCGMEGRQGEVPEIFALNGSISEAARHFGDAQFALTGTFPSFDDPEEEGEEAEPAEAIAVLARHDFLITDRDALMAAGRAAYLEAWPADVEDDAKVDVQTVGRAVYQLMHASGEGKILSDVPGLRPNGNVHFTLEVEEPLDFDDPFAIYCGDDDGQ